MSFCTTRADLVGAPLRVQPVQLLLQCRQAALHALHAVAAVALELLLQAAELGLQALRELLREVLHLRVMRL